MPVAATAPGTTGAKRSALFAGWAVGLPDQRNAGPNAEPIVGDVCEWMHSLAENPRPYEPAAPGYAARNYGASGVDARLVTTVNE
eukprot:8569509-Alexandrium_andersonii.AAC.1